MATFELVRVAGSTVLRVAEVVEGHDDTGVVHVDIELTPHIVAEAVAGMSRHDVVELLLDVGMADTRDAREWHGVGRDLNERISNSNSARRVWFLLRTVLNGLETKEGDDHG